MTGNRQAVKLERTQYRWHIYYLNLQEEAVKMFRAVCQTNKEQDKKIEIEKSAHIYNEEETKQIT